MTLEKDFEDFIQLMNKHKVAHMIVGGYALALHGRPRHTGDLDIWINISDDNATRLVTVLNDFGMGQLGFQKEDFLQPGYITQIGYPPLRIDILNTIDGVSFEEARAGMQTLQLENNLSIHFIGLADFLKNKQASGRKQDIADIKEIKELKEKPKVSRRRGLHP
jgi:predicted nucleotidyltransferase